MHLGSLVGAHRKTAGRIYNGTAGAAGCGREGGGLGAGAYAPRFGACSGLRSAAKSRKLKSVLEIAATPFKISTSDFETS